MSKHTSINSFPHHAFIHALFFNPRYFYCKYVPPSSPRPLQTWVMRLVGCRDFHTHFIGMALPSPPDLLKPHDPPAYAFQAPACISLFLSIINSTYTLTCVHPQRPFFRFLAFTFPSGRFSTVRWMLPTFEHT